MDKFRSDEQHWIILQGSRIDPLRQTGSYTGSYDRAVSLIIEKRRLLREQGFCKDDDFYIARRILENEECPGQ